MWDTYGICFSASNKIANPITSTHMPYLYEHSVYTHPSPCKAYAKQTTHLDCSRVEPIEIGKGECGLGIGNGEVLDEIMQSG